MSRSKPYAPPQGKGTSVPSRMSARLDAAQPGGPRARLSQSPFVRLHQIESGCWEVSDEANRRGGLFRDFRSAARFIKHEFQMMQPSLVIVSGGKENPTS